MRRALSAYLGLGMVLALFATIGWLTNNPDAAILERAERWPYVGPLAERFRSSYLEPPPPEQQPTPEELWLRRKPIDFVLPMHDEPTAHIWVLPGTILRGSRVPAAKALWEFDQVTRVGKIERRGDWFRVRHSGSEGWVFLEGYDEEAEEPYGNAPEPPRPLPSRDPDPEWLATARGYLGQQQREGRLGPYRLFTDCDEGALVAFLAGIATRLDRVYAARYGQSPTTQPREAVVLYRSELSYRLLQQRSKGLTGLATSGHASQGVAALYIGERELAEVGATLIHELSHFVNRRAIGPQLPPWLDEGLADGLATSRLGDDGSIEPLRLGGERRESDRQRSLDGALSSLWRLRQALRNGDLPPLRELLGLDWDAFVRSRRSRTHYALSAFWVRYLLAEPQRATAFRRFLAAVASGESPAPEALARLLGHEWSTLDTDLHQWLVHQSRAEGIENFDG